MAVTVAGVRKRIQNNLYSARPPLRPFEDILNDTVTASTADATITVTTGTSWAAGDILEMNGGEQMRVVSVATNVLTVVRAFNDTTLETGVAGDLIRKSPRFTLAQIDEAVEDTVRDLPSHGVFVWGTGVATLVAGQSFYSITDTGLIDVLSVYKLEATTLIPIPVPFTHNKNIHATVTAGGQGLHLWEWAGEIAGGNLYYTYSKAPAAVTDLLDRQQELAVIGSTYRLLAKTIGPETHDPGKRTDRAVQPGQTSRDSRWWETEYLIKVRRESQILANEKDDLVNNTMVSRANRYRARTK